MSSSERYPAQRPRHKTTHKWTRQQTVDHALHHILCRHTVHRSTLAQPHVVFHSFVHSFIHSFIHSFVLSFIHSFKLCAHTQRGTHKTAWRRRPVSNEVHAARPLLPGLCPWSRVSSQEVGKVCLVWRLRGSTPWGWEASDLLHETLPRHKKRDKKRRRLLTH